MVVKHPVRFIVIALVWAFFFMGLNVIAGLGTETFVGMGLIILGGASPMLAALYLVLREGGSKGLVRFLEGLWDIKRIGAFYWVVAIFLPLVILWLSVYVTQLISGDPAFVLQRDFSRDYWSVIPFAILVLIMGPLPEEIGWRGYLLPALGRSINLLKASLIIAIVWGLWHLPLFFIDGYPLAEKLQQPLSLIPYFTLLLPKAIVYTWLFFKTRRSILAVVVFHFSVNFFGMIWDTTLTAGFTELVVWFLTAVWVVYSNRELFTRTLTEI